MARVGFNGENESESEGGSDKDGGRVILLTILCNRRK